MTLVKSISETTQIDEDVIRRVISHLSVIPLPSVAYYKAGIALGEATAENPNLRLGDAFDFQFRAALDAVLKEGL